MKATFDFAALITVLIVCTGCVAEKQCYSPNGTLAGNTPCFPNADVSFCCGTGWVCTTNLLCVTPVIDLAGNYSHLQRGTCTDPSWNSAACPSFCRGGAYDNGGAESVWSCGNGEYECTPADGAATCQSSAIFNLGAIENITTIGGATGAAFTTALPITSSSTSSRSSSSSSSSSSSPQASAQTSAPAQHSSLSGGAKAGIAVGVVVGVILMAVAAFFFVRQSKKTRQLQQHIEGLYTGGVPKTAHHDGLPAPDGANNQENGISELPVAQQDRSPHELEATERRK